MNKKQFTLTELIIAVVVISLLVSISTVKILDVKNKSIGVAVANNTKIIQTAVDRYALDNNGEYPIKNELTINLQKPQLINLELLKSKGYLKKELDTTKIKTQYYWLDVFGVAWGSTEPTIDNISSIADKNGKSRLEFITPEGVTSYRVYEVMGYNKLGNIVNNKDRHYKLINEVKLGKKRQKVNFEIPDSSKTYLISAVDKYEQETVPVGVFYKGASQFKPILSGDGIYEFEIDSFDEMFWVGFKTIEDTPGASTISYSFKVKDKNEVYMDWTSDFKSLQSSRSITVKVDMKSDAEGNKPSLYDINVMYRYAYEEKIPSPSTELTNPKEPSTVCPAGYTNSSIKNGKWAEGTPKIVTYLTDLPNGEFINQVKNPSFYGYSIVSVRYEYAKEDGSYVEVSGTLNVPAGSCVNIIYELEVSSNEEDGILKHSNPEKGEVEPTNPDGGNAGGNPEGPSIPEDSKNPSNPAIPNDSMIVRIPGGFSTFSPEIVICKTNCVPICEDCVPSCLENCESYCDTHDCTKEESCKQSDCIEPPVCMEGDIGCSPPACTDNCSEGPPTAPNPQDAEVNDPDWVNVETLRFFATGPMGIQTRWIGMIPNHEFEEGKTRIIYRYAKSNGHYWSREIKEINQVGQSRSLMVIAYLQVHKDVKVDANQKPPKINSLRILHERGAINLSDSQPTLVILPVKNNNEGRDVFSDASIFDWQYTAADPKGRKITEIEWSGDKFEKYPVGTYTIKARVKNETELWSEEVEYTFDILPEKPVAKITKNVNNVYLNKDIIWSAAQSVDPDGDKIVKFEWRGDKRITYDKLGTYNVGLRVQDSEGYWSDWVEETFEVKDEGVKVYRLESEDTDTTKVVRKVGYVDGANSTNTIIDSNFSEGKYTKLHVGAYHINKTFFAQVEFKFTGTGFDLKQLNPLNANVSLDGQNLQTITKSGESIYSLRDLENKQHSLVVHILYGGSSSVDYLDVYNTDDTPNIANIYSKSLDKNDVENPQNTNIVNVRLNQKIRTYYSLHKDSHVTIGVYNSSGKEIKKLVSNAFLQGGTTGNHFVNWDGKDVNGELLETGAYTLKMKAIGIKNEGQIEETYLLKVENEKISYRLESEDTDTTKVVRKVGYVDGANSTNIISDSSYSGGKYTYLNVYATHGSKVFSAQVEFKFTGTGFDLKQVNPINTSISLDGVKLQTLNQSGESIYSLRNLEDKQHSLIIQVLYGGRTFVDYLDVYNTNDTPNITNIYSKSIGSDSIENSYTTNIISIKLKQKINTYYTVFKDSYITIGIYDSTGKEVKSLLNNKFLEGGTTSNYSIIWDGKDNNGETLESGKYDLRIKAVGNNKKGHMEKIHTLTLENEKASYRLEADSSDTTKVVRTVGYNGSGNSTNAVSDPTSSGGIYTQLYAGAYHINRTYSAQVEFKFTGTGFDLRQISPLNSNIYLDGVKVITITKTGESFYSLRNLDNKQHSLKVQILYGGSAAVDYLDVYQ